MLRIFISGKLTDGADTERGFPQCTAGLAELQLFYNSKKSAACTFPDKCAEMGGAVSEMCSSVMECGCTVILTEIIQNLRNTAVAGRFCENGFDIILMIAQKLSPQHHQLGIQESGVVSGVEHIFDIKILQCGTDLRVFSCMKDQEVPLRFLIEHMGKKFRKCAVSGK